MAREDGTNEGFHNSSGFTRTTKKVAKIEVEIAGKTKRLLSKAKNFEAGKMGKKYLSEKEIDHRITWSNLNKDEYIKWIKRVLTMYT